MHNGIINIANEDYLPVRAITFHTNYHFSPQEVMCLLSNIESHSDSRFSAGVVPYLYSENEKPEYQAPNMLFKYRLNLNTVLEQGGDFLNQLKSLPKNMLVKLSDMRALNDFLTNLSTSIDYNHHNNFQWQENPTMTSDEKSIVYEGFQKLSKKISKKVRANSTEVKFQMISDALIKVEEICNKNNIRFSRDHVPGQKTQLLECIKLIDPRIIMMLSTFDSKSYIDKLKLKWHQGGKMSSGYAMVDAVRKEMG